MANVFKFEEGFYEFRSSYISIKILRRNPNHVHPECLSNFFQFIKYEILNSINFYKRDIMSDFYYLDNFILGFEGDCISIVRVKNHKDRGYDIKIREEVKYDLIQKLDDF